MPPALAAIEPFEICSIRPPTENYSLTFRLTRNCHWNRCKFCPVYKLGARFNRRSQEDVLEDIQRAKQIDDLLLDHGIIPGFAMGDPEAQVQDLLERIHAARETSSPENPETEDAADLPEDLDPRLAWFLTWFKDKPTLADSFQHILTWRKAGGQTCFLGDADGLILPPEFLIRTIHHIKAQFPSLLRFTIYGRTQTAAKLRSPAELLELRLAGLDRIHFGLESGCDTVLKFMDKGVCASEHIEAGLKTREAGLSCSVYVMPGLGGKQWSEIHARDTAAVLTRMAPDYVRLRSLEIFPRTPLEAAAQSGAFIEASETDLVREIRILVEETGCKTEFVSDSAANLLQINGRLPEDREAMLKQIDAYLILKPFEQKIFSVQARLMAFMGQYGGITADIGQFLQPYLRNNRLDFSHAGEDELDHIIRLIRSKLMP